MSCDEGSNCVTSILNNFFFCKDAQGCTCMFQIILVGLMYIFIYSKSFINLFLGTGHYVGAWDIAVSKTGNL